MRRRKESTGFWAPGASIFDDELSKEKNARLAPLQSQIEAERDPVRKTELKRQIAAIKAEFRSKRRNAAYSLFSKA